MPSSARKSSISAARRGPQKPHIPYRGDNPEIGKKTGIAVQHVERKSDGFEPFEQIMQQADQRTPPRVKSRKSSKKSLPQEIEEDLDGEMTMELDDSPVHYFATARQPATPSGSYRAGSSSRPVTRTSDIDFDKVPSPRPRGSLRKSMGNGYDAGPSTLSQSMVHHDLFPPSDDDEDDMNGGGMDDGFDDCGAKERGGSPEPTSPHETSFSQMDQDEDNHEEQQPDEPPQTTSPVENGKRREMTPEEEQEDEPEEEDHIAQGLEDIEQEPPSDEGEEGHLEPQAEPPTKKAKFAEEGAKMKGKSQQGKMKKENRPYREGTRRSAREHYKPLEWWRGEKLIYGRTGSGRVLVPSIKEIKRIPKEAPVPLGKRKRGTTRTRSKSRGGYTTNPEEGWDDETEQQCVVLEYPHGSEVKRRIAFTAQMVHAKPAANNDWSFQKVFGDGEFIAAGQLIIPPNGRKPSKGTKDNTYIFYVIEGAVNLKVHDTSLVLATGGMFMVPRGNTYFIENIADRDAKLFFTQARKIAMGEEEIAAHYTSAPPPERKSSLAPPPPTPQQQSQAPRSSSTGTATAAAAAGKGKKRAASTRV